jgi:hypothetical protein
MSRGWWQERAWRVSKRCVRVWVWCVHRAQCIQKLTCAAFTLLMR